MSLGDKRIFQLCRASCYLKLFSFLSLPLRQKALPTIGVKTEYCFYGKQVRIWEKKFLLSCRVQPQLSACRTCRTRSTFVFSCLQSELLIFAVTLPLTSSLLNHFVCCFDVQQNVISVFKKTIRNDVLLCLWWELMVSIAALGLFIQFSSLRFPQNRYSKKI